MNAKRFCTECEMTFGHTEKCSLYTPRGFGGRKVGATKPMPMVIPKGWRSMHREVEYSLCILWPERDVKLPREERRCLDKFHKKQRTAADKGKENALGTVLY